MPRTKKASSLNNFYVIQPLLQKGGRKFLDTIATIGMLHGKKRDPRNNWEIVSLDEGYLHYAGSAFFYGLVDGLPFFSHEEPPDELNLTLISVKEWLKRIGS